MGANLATVVFTEDGVVEFGYLMLRGWMSDCHAERLSLWYLDNTMLYFIAANRIVYGTTDCCTEEE